MELYIDNNELKSNKKNSLGPIVPIALTIIIVIVGFIQFGPSVGGNNGDNPDCPNGNCDNPTQIDQTIEVPENIEDPSCDSYVSKKNSSQISMQLSREWMLLGNEFSQKQKTLDINATIDENTAKEDITVQYLVTENERSQYLKKDNNRNNKYSGQVNISSFEPGTYNVKTIVTGKCLYLISKPKTVKVSYPLYVAWTTDWEGEVGYSSTYNYSLGEMERISNSYGLPITHMFNPRIYLPAFSQAEANKYTNWVKNRAKNNGDEIALHMHMFYDMVQAAGVEPKKEPKWDDGSRGGYNIPSSAYTYEENMQIFSWAMTQFENHELGKPVSYRAGGWMADASVLRAATDSGIEIDSSGRTQDVNNNDLISNYWYLSKITPPYKPCEIDPNMSECQDKIGLWEVANNGGDSYSQSSTQLTQRFKDNHEGNKPLDELRSVVYVSHPPWATREFPRMEPALKYIAQYKYSDDNGPVIFATLSEIKEAAEK